MPTAPPEQSSIRKPLPPRPVPHLWRTKVFIQTVLSCLPFGNKLNDLCQLWNGAYSPKNMEETLWYRIDALNKAHRHVSLPGATVVEMGTGWVAYMPILLYLYGARRCYAYDHIPHLQFNMVTRLLEIVGKNLKKISELSNIPLRKLERRLGNIAGKNNLEEFLRAARIKYKSPSDAADTGLADGIADLVLSYAMLSHVPRQALAGVLKEASRLTRDQGKSFHCIGLLDTNHKEESQVSKINFLKYSTRFYNFFINNKINYHNRLREPEYLKLFEECGYCVEYLESEVDESDLAQLGQMKVAEEFKRFDNRQLAVWKMIVVLSARSPASDSIPLPNGG